MGVLNFASQVNGQFLNFPTRRPASQNL